MPTLHVQEYTTSTTYKLFSGDCLNPSELSTTTKGIVLYQPNKYLFLYKAWVLQFKKSVDRHLKHVKGYHMVDIMNELDVDCAVYGNHEFDFGIAPLQAGITEHLDGSH